MYAERIRAHIAAGLRAFGAPASSFVRHLLRERRERATEQPKIFQQILWTDIPATLWVVGLWVVGVGEIEPEFCTLVTSRENGVIFT